MPSFFTLKFSLFAIGGLLLTLLVVLGGEELRIRNWRTENKAQADQIKLDAANLAVCHANLATLSSSIDTQNTAIGKMKQDALNAKAAADARVKAALAARAAVPKITGTGPDVMNAWYRAEYGVAP